MTRARPTRRWLACILLLLLLAPPLVVRLLYPRTPSVAVEALLPDHISAALRIDDLQSAWDKHWKDRPGATPATAVRELMVAMDSWPKWVAKYGESGANLRIDAYQKAIFSLAGKEAWIVFGEWLPSPGAAAQSAAAAGAQGEAGLVILLRGDDQLRARIGPIASLILGEYKIEHSVKNGVGLYTYESKKLARSITFGQVGGWLCASWRQRGEGPLPLIAARARRAAAGDAANQDPHQAFSEFWPSLSPLQSAPAIAALVYPQRLWGQLRQFNFQRKKAMSPLSDESLSKWQQRLDGVETLRLVQSGSSLFDLIASVEGPRPTLLESQWRAVSPALASASPFSSGIVATSHTLVPPPRAAPAALAMQLDMSLSFAQSLAPIAGFNWSDWLAALKPVDKIVPGLQKALRPSLEGVAESERGERVGLAMFRSIIPLIPKLLYWRDAPPYRDAPEQLPALSWAADGIDNEATTNSLRKWLASPAPFGLPRSADAETSQVAPVKRVPGGAELWKAAPFPPAAFATVQFAPLREDLDTIPTILLKSKDKKSVERVQNIIHALELSCGAGMGLRVDLNPTQWIVRTQAF